MRFAKYHGIGNDFVMIADLADEVVLTPELVRALCNRRFGIGADGVIRVAPSRVGAELFMDYVNSDGSMGEMCGNGIRCLAVFARAERLTSSRDIAVETRAGVKVVHVSEASVTVDMGPPAFEPEKVPVTWEGRDALHAKIELDDGVVEAACLSMGNPHAVVFVDDLAAAPVDTLGPRLEHHPAFPAGVNVSFVDVRDRGFIAMRVWERGSKETHGCGTGACAAAVATRLLAGGERRTTVALPGGHLDVEWAGGREDAAPVFLTGPAEHSFDGEVDLEDYR